MLHFSGLLEAIFQRYFGIKKKRKTYTEKGR